MCGLINKFHVAHKTSTLWNLKPVYIQKNTGLKWTSWTMDMECEKRKLCFHISCAITYFVYLYPSLSLYVGESLYNLCNNSFVYYSESIFHSIFHFLFLLRLSHSFCFQNWSKLPEKNFLKKKNNKKSKHLCSTSFTFSHMCSSLSFSLSLCLSFSLSIYMNLCLFLSHTHIFNLFITHTLARLFVDPNYCVSIYTYMCVLRAAFKQNVSKEL